MAFRRCSYLSEIVIKLNWDQRDHYKRFLLYCYKLNFCVFGEMLNYFQCSSILGHLISM